MRKLSVAKRIFILVVFCAAAAIATRAQTFTVLHGFDGTDGANVAGGMVQSTGGKLYGTTSNGGAHGMGTIFTITPSGTLVTLHSFDGPDGDGPSATLVQATDGNLYGTTFKARDSFQNHPERRLDNAVQLRPHGRSLS